MNTTSPTRNAERGTRTSRRASLLATALLAFILHLSTFILSAFPPALPHTIYGMARDEYGNPLRTNATIVLTTSTGLSVSAQVETELEPGVNYRLVVPLDSGVKSDAYKTGALQSTVPFRIRVTINNATFLPIEMTGDYSLLGQPGKQTRIDLTLGEDTNGNGLPDAWERAMIAARGWNVTLNDLTGSSSLGTNGVTLLQEYVAGTYGFEDGNGLNLAIARIEAGTPVLEFLAVRGRTYTIVGSTNLKAWMPVPFRPLLPDADAEPVSTYLSPDVRLLQVAVPASATGTVPLFYKLQIQ
ncbi:MAG: hypothetical protein HZA92_09795 [Verrucomicrobia bacterium]|nr:hypothetical protein [Verrucomicrobiota bacterium]